MNVHLDRRRLHGFRNFTNCRARFQLDADGTRPCRRIALITPGAQGPVYFHRRCAPARCCAYPAKAAVEHSTWYPSRKTR